MDAAVRGDQADAEAAIGPNPLERAVRIARNGVAGGEQSQSKERDSHFGARTLGGRSAFRRDVERPIA
jgi:hypothetical protein